MDSVKGDEAKVSIMDKSKLRGVNHNSEDIVNSKTDCKNQLASKYTNKQKEKYVNFGPTLTKERRVKSYTDLSTSGNADKKKINTKQNAEKSQRDLNTETTNTKPSGSPTNHKGNSSFSVLGYNKLREDLEFKSHIPRCKSLMELSKSQSDAEHIQNLLSNMEKDNRTRRDNAANFVRGCKLRLSEIGTASSSGIHSSSFDPNKTCSNFKRSSTVRLSERGTSGNLNKEQSFIGRRRKFGDKDSHATNSSNKKWSTFETMKKYDEQRRLNRPNSDISSSTHNLPTASKIISERLYSLAKKTASTNRVKSADQVSRSTQFLNDNDDVRNQQLSNDKLFNNSKSCNQSHLRSGGKRALPKLPFSGASALEVEERRKRISAAALERVQRGLHALRNEVKQELQQQQRIPNNATESNDMTVSNVTKNAAVDRNLTSNKNDSNTEFNKTDYNNTNKNESQNLHEGRVKGSDNDKTFHKASDSSINSALNIKNTKPVISNSSGEDTEIHIRELSPMDSTPNKDIEVIVNCTENNVMQNSDNLKDSDETAIRVVELESGYSSSEHGIVENDLDIQMNESKMAIFEKEDEKVSHRILETDFHGEPFPREDCNGMQIRENESSVKQAHCDEISTLTNTNLGKITTTTNPEDCRDLSKHAIQKLIHDLRDAANKPIGSNSNSSPSSSISSTSMPCRLLTPQTHDYVAMEYRNPINERKNNASRSSSNRTNESSLDNINRCSTDSKAKIISLPENSGKNREIATSSFVKYSKTTPVINPELYFIKKESHFTNQIGVCSIGLENICINDNNQRPCLHRIVQTCDLVSVVLPHIDSLEKMQQELQLYESPYYEGVNKSGELYIIRPPVGKRQNIGASNGAFAPFSYGISNTGFTKICCDDEPVPTNGKKQFLVAINLLSGNSVPGTSFQKVYDGDFLIEVNGSFTLPMSLKEVENSLEAAAKKGNVHLTLARPKVHPADSGKGELDYKKEYEKMRFKFDSLKEEVDRNLDMIADLRCNLKDKDSHIQHLQIKSRQSHKTIINMDKELKEKEHKINNWMLDVNKRDSEIARLKFELKHNDDKMQELKKLLIQQNEVMLLQQSENSQNGKLLNGHLNVNNNGFIFGNDGDNTDNQFHANTNQEHYLENSFGHNLVSSPEDVTLHSGNCIDRYLSPEIENKEEKVSAV